MIADLHYFLPSILAEPAEEAHRCAYADWLTDRDEWTWSTVLGHVLVHPDNDGPRLLAALWCEQHGQGERAEFIRVQCELAKWEKWASEQFLVLPESRQGQYIDALRRRERELLDGWHGGAQEIRNWAEWAGALAVKLTGETVPVFRRGFVECLTLTADAWLEHADALCAATPVREVVLTTMPDYVAVLRCYLRHGASDQAAREFSSMCGAGIILSGLAAFRVLSEILWSNGVTFHVGDPTPSL